MDRVKGWGRCWRSSENATVRTWHWTLVLKGNEGCRTYQMIDGPTFDFI
jgi:hypothetical protein